MTTGVAHRLHDLLVHLTGVEPPVCLVGWDGSRAGSGHGPTVHLRHRRAVRRLLWAPGELGLARAYVAGELDIEGDLVTALRQLADVGARVGSRPSLTPADRRELMRTAVLVGAVGPAPKPPLAELDPTGERWPRGHEQTVSVVDPADAVALFHSVLGPTLSYSCARWSDPAHANGQKLDEAQTAKLEQVCADLDLRPGSRLLDLGCGWGSLLIHAAEQHGTRGVGTIRSADRVELVRREITARGLDSLIDIRLGDHADVSDAPYDAVACLEGNEHVPTDAQQRWADSIAMLLRPGGRLLIQRLTRRDEPGDERTFMQMYVYPRAPLGPVGQLIEAVERAGLELRTATSMREHYPPTMQAWADNLSRHRILAVDAVGESRVRVWELSLALSILALERGRVSVHQLLAVRAYADGSLGEHDPARIASTPS
jgi:cyclopropane-fatty-acyl-phospholipid synthase